MSRPAGTTRQTRHDEDPMTYNIIHYLLVTTNRLQRIPALGVLGLLVTLSAVVGLAWLARADQELALLMAAASLFVSLSDWLVLWLLPVVGRSFGPERPPTLSLAVVRTIAVLTLAIFSAAPWLIITGHIFLSIIVAYTTWVEPFRLGVTRQTLHFPGWARGNRPLRLLHIGDLHLERITQRERDLNRLIDDLQPDLLVFSGDFVNVSYTHDPTTFDHIREIIAAWSAPLGVYCVAGTYTVEPLTRVREFVHGLENLCLLEDEWASLSTDAGPLHLLGMTTTHRLAVDHDKVHTLMLQSPPGPGLKLLLTHSPDSAPAADAAGYDLYLCGHTHGGQLRLPLIGPLFTGSAFGRRYVMGRYDLENTTLYTSRGVGMEGMGAPRARLLCPPEIILWEIHGTA